MTTTTTDRVYGPQTAGIGRTIQDIGLCNLNGEYLYTAKTRAKGLLVITFFSPKSAPSINTLRTIDSWSSDITPQKWTALALTEGDRAMLTEFAQQQELNSTTILVDNELYHTRAWGVSHLPSVYLISGKTGRVLMKVLGDGESDLRLVKDKLSQEVNLLTEAEEAAKKAAEEAAKKA